MPSSRRPVRLALVPTLILAVVGCVGHGEPAPMTDQEAAVIASHPELQPRTPAPAIPSGSLRGTNLNIELRVEKPTPMADAIRTIGLEMGGEIQGLSADETSGSGSITVSLDPDRVERFRHALARLPATVIRENSSSNDMTMLVGQLDDRLRKLDRAEAEMDRLMRATTDRDAFEAWVVQRELNTRERDSLRGQIASYLQHVRRSHVTVSLTNAAPPEGVVHPAIRHGEGFRGEEG